MHYSGSRSVAICSLRLKFAKKSKSRMKRGLRGKKPLLKAYLFFAVVF